MYHRNPTEEEGGIMKANPLGLARIINEKGKSIHGSGYEQSVIGWLDCLDVDFCCFLGLY